MNITYKLAGETLGDDSDAPEQAAYIQSYISALTGALQADYPDAAIDVSLKSDFCNASQLLVSGVSDDQDEDAIREGVERTARRIWERAEFSPA